MSEDFNPPRPPGLIPSSTPAHQEILGARRAVLNAQLASIAGDRNRSVWEVGCGHGHFLTAYAAKHPTSLCIGIDIASDRIARAVRKRDRAGHSNLHFIHAEARLFLDVLPVELRFAEVFVLFPDPWPKSRHHKHRVMQPDFLAAVARRMADGGRLFFRTDHAPYFEHTKEILAAHPDWSLSEGEIWPFEMETVFQSRAERYMSLSARVRQA